MAKLTLTDINGGYISVSAINANYALIEAALENTLSRDGTAPNTMSAGIDMNSSGRLVNLLDAVNNQEPVTLAQAVILAGVDAPLTRDIIGDFLYPDTQEEIDQSAVIVNSYREQPDPRRYGAAHDTTATAAGTDNTAYFATAMSVNTEEIPVRFTGQVGDLTVTSHLNGYGYGKVLALAGSTSAFRLIRNTDWGLWHGMHFQNLYLDMTGDAAPRTIHGYMYYPDTDTQDSTLGGRNMWTNCVIKNADRGIYQTRGNFGNRIYGGEIIGCNYGIFAVENNTPNIMHTGFLQTFGGQISGSKKAAIYMNCPTESINGTIISNTSIQDNQGHGIYLEGINVCVEPILLLATHFENNDQASAGTIDLGFGKGVESIRDLMCHDVDHIKIIGTPVNAGTGFEFNNSMASLDGCYFNTLSILVQDASSVVVCKNANLDGIGYLADVQIDSLVQQRRPSGTEGLSMMAKIPHRSKMTHNLPGTGVGLFGQSHAHADYDYTGTGGTGTRTHGGGMLYDHFNIYTALQASTGYVSPLLALTQNKWYVYSALVRKEAYDVANVYWWTSAGRLAKDAGDILDNNVPDNEWVTVGGVCEYDQTSANTRFTFTTDSGTVPDMSFGPVQLVQFDTQKEAIAYFNEGWFWDSEQYEYSGTGTLSGGSLAVDFTDEGFQDQPDVLYNIKLTPDSSTNAYISAQSATGFTMAGGTTDEVQWEVTRRSL